MASAPGLDKNVIRALTQKSDWVAQHENIFVLGPTGIGKSFVACALGQKACRDGYSALYLRAAALFRDLAIARADGSLRSLLIRLSRIQVLLINDWAMAPLAETEGRDFWEICEDRYQARSTQLPVTPLARTDGPELKRRRRGRSRYVITVIIGKQFLALYMRRTSLGSAYGAAVLLGASLLLRSGVYESVRGDPSTPKRAQQIVTTS